MDRSNLFHSPVDRFVFLSILAAVCLDCGRRIHAFCLMTNHFLCSSKTPAAKGDVVAYALWRFAREGRMQLSRAVTGTVDQFVRRVQRIASLRLRNPAVHEALSRLEWRMTFALGAGPWRA